MNEESNLNQVNNKKDAAKVVLIVILTILLIASLSFTAYDKLIKKDEVNSDTNTEESSNSSISGEEINIMWCLSTQGCINDKTLSKESNDIYNYVVNAFNSKKFKNKIDYEIEPFTSAKDYFSEDYYYSIDIDFNNLSNSTSEKIKNIYLNNKNEIFEIVSIDDEKYYTNVYSIEVNLYDYLNEILFEQ